MRGGFLQLQVVDLLCLNIETCSSLDLGYLLKAERICSTHLSTDLNTNQVSLSDYWANSEPGQGLRAFPFNFKVSQEVGSIPLPVRQITRFPCFHFCEGL